DPVHTYRPLRPKPGRLRGIEGLESPTIGREKELALLYTALENLHRGVGHLVFLTGEAGIGKSRLIRELKEATHRTALHWYEVAPLSFEATQPYALFRSFLRQVLGLQEMDSAAEILPKLAVMTEQVSTEVREGGLRALALLLGTQDNGDAGSSPDGEAFKRQLFAATREAISGIFSQTPGVIVLDDLHWADPASLELFNHLFPLVETRPILFLCASRPDRDTPVWPVKTTLAETYPHRVTEIPVLPLSSEKSNVLVDHLITTTHLPTQIRSLILERAEGNPFFLEEIVRTLIEDGILVRHIPSAEGHSEWRVVETNLPRLHIPDNLQTLLAARLDRLQEETRRVLQLAAVIGRNFYYRVLEGLTEPVAGLDTQLSTLQRMNMVVEAARLPELEYAFRHTLVQETAYQSILRKQRREFHRQVGEVMEQLFSERLEIYAPILALHFERAGDSARAFRYYRMAGEEASRLYAVKEAISHYIRALDLMKSFAEPLPSEEVCQLWLRLGRAYELDGRYDEALLHYQEMETFAQTHHQQTLELAALAAHATIHAAPTKKFDRTQAITLSQNALALAEQLEDHATEAKIYWNLMMMSGFSGEGEQGYAYGLRSLEIARQYQLKEQLAYTLHDFHRASLIQGKIEEAETMLAEAKDIWRELGNKAMYIDSLISEALFHIIHSEYARGEAACLEAHRLSLEIGNLWGQCYADYTLGFIYYEQGRFNLALEVMPRALRLVESSGFAVPLVDSHCYMGLIYAYLGDFDRGKMHVMEALHHAQERLPAMQTGPLSALAILEFLQGNLEALDHWLGDFRPNPEINSFTGFMRFISEIYRLLAKEKYPELL
ncbi:MAG: AAA family ATPase, partial [Anaerolineales bacterium]|nr:AAA family ATPase [Anaerolineales bacterium]